MEDSKTPETSNFEFDGHTFRDCAEFCDFYGLKYTSVRYYVQRGFSYQEILDFLRQNPKQAREKEGSLRSRPCSYSGVTYPSITQAAEALGIPAHLVYEYLRKHNVSTDEALEMVVKGVQSELEVRETSRSGRARPVTVEGTLYPSRAEACHAYGVPLITVYSKMERKGSSFEEALVESARGNRAAKPAKTLWAGLSLSPADPGSMDKAHVIPNLLGCLTKNGFTPQYFEDKEKNIGAVRFEAALHMLEQKTGIYRPY